MVSIVELPLDGKGEYTKDGSVGMNKMPALRSKTGGWKACSFLCVFEACERMVFCGIMSNMVIYMTNNMQQGTVMASKNVNIWAGITFIVPVFGALVADTRLGRFRAFGIFSIIYVMGMILLTMSVIIPSLKPQPCNTKSHCEKPSRIQVGFFYLALYVIALGAGGAKPNLTTIGADQFDHFDEKEKLQKTSFFNWWNVSLFSGSLIGQTFMIYIQDNLGFEWGYGIPTIMFVLGMTAFFFGTPFYRHKLQTTNAFMQLAQVVTASMRRRNVNVAANPKGYNGDSLYINEHHIANKITTRVMDKASTEPESRNQCTITEVEETKTMLKLLPIWLFLLMPCLIFSQSSSLFIKQATKLDRKLGNKGFEIPAGSLAAVKTLSLILTIIIYDKLLVKIFKKFTGNSRGLTNLQRTGVGMVLIIMTMVAACIADAKRIQLVKKQGLSNNPKAVAPMSVMILAPQFILLGISSGFIDPAMLEFFYEEAPPSMKSTSTAFMFVALGLGNLLSSLVLTLVEYATLRLDKHHGWISDNLNDSCLYYYFAFLGFLCLLNSIAFGVISRKYVYKKDTEVADGKLAEVQGKV